MSDQFKPQRPVAGTVTTGFRPLGDDTSWDRQPIYRIVEITRDAEGRLHRQGHVWHNDLSMLRRFGRAVAANTASHKVLITNSHGDVVGMVASTESLGTSTLNASSAYSERSENLL